MNHLGLTHVTCPDTGKVYPIPSGGAGDEAGDGAGDGAGMPDGEQTDSDSGDGAGTDPAAEAAKWKAMARKHEQQAKANADKARRLDELEDSQKSELEKLTGKATEAEQRAAKAEATALRLEVALDKAPEGLSVAKIRKLAARLQGASREELEADAAELFAEFADQGAPDMDRRPKERLKPGASNEDADPSGSDAVEAVWKATRGA